MCLNAPLHGLLGLLLALAPQNTEVTVVCANVALHAQISAIKAIIFFHNRFVNS